MSDHDIITKTGHTGYRGEGSCLVGIMFGVFVSMYVSVSFCNMHIQYV